MAIDSITQRQLRKFVFSGVIAVMVDFGVYYMANNYLGHNLSKGLSFLSGSVVAYLLNKFWTFEAKEFSGSQMFRFFFLYGMTLAINVFVNKFVLATIGNVLFGFLCATAASTILNFFGQKFWVFKK